MTSILRGRQEAYVERRIRDYQHGFREGKSTIDAAHVVTQIMEKHNEH